MSSGEPPSQRYGPPPRDHSFRALMGEGLRALRRDRSVTRSTMEARACWQIADTVATRRATASEAAAAKAKLQTGFAATVRRRRLPRWVLMSPMVWPKPVTDTLALAANRSAWSSALRA